MRRGTWSAAAGSIAGVLGLYGSAATQAATALPPIARPNPAFVSVHPDYVGPIAGVAGTPAELAPLDPAVIEQAVADQQYLAYKTAGDLGGFAPAPTGQFAGSSGGRSLVGETAGSSEIPQLAQAADGKVDSFAATGGGSSTPPDQGQQPLPGLGTPPPVRPPSNDNTVPPPNQGFGGTPPPTPAPSPTTTAPATTTTPTTTPAATTTPAPTPPPPPPETTLPVSPPPFVGASCGTVGLTITSDHSTCRIYAVNMAPGQSASEVMTVRNDTPDPFTLSLQAAGTTNALWDELRLGVWEADTAAPVPLPSLLSWTAQSNTLATLRPGQSIRYEIELLLPATAGNGFQGLAASIDLIWRAQG